MIMIMIMIMMLFLNTVILIKRVYENKAIKVYTIIGCILTIVIYIQVCKMHNTLHNKVEEFIHNGYSNIVEEYHWRRIM